MNPLPDPAAATALTVAGGRVLGYICYGTPAGPALIYCHGHPGSRLEARFLSQAASRCGVQLIGIDRPGMGLSTFQPRRRLMDWPRDVAELADRLGLEQFSVLGYSGGAPYALACAHQLAQRVRSVGLVSGVADVGKVVRLLAGTIPRVTMPVFRRMFTSPQRAGQTLARVSRRWVPADRAALTQDGVQDLMAASLAESFRGGWRGPAVDAAVLGRPWGFGPEQISSATVHLWHGTKDHQVNPARARAAAAALPRCQPMFYPEEGHISVIVNHADEIVHALLGSGHA